MAVKASAEAIREMKRNISNTIRDVQRISGGIRSGVNATANWDDAQGQQFKALMQQIASLTESPVEALNAALPKLEKLAQSLDEYTRIKF